MSPTCGIDWFSVIALLKKINWAGWSSTKQTSSSIPRSPACFRYDIHVTAKYAHLAWNSLVGDDIAFIFANMYQSSFIVGVFIATNLQSRWSTIHKSTFINIYLYICICGRQDIYNEVIQDGPNIWHIERSWNNIMVWLC